MKNILFVFIFCMSCATLKTGKDGSVQVEYQGTSNGVSQILAEQNRQLQSAQAGAIAMKAVENGKPATLGQDAGRSDLQAGYSYGYGYGMMGYSGIYGNNPTLLAAEAASRGGYAGGYLPRLGEAPVYVQPSTVPQVVQTASGSGGAVSATDCPTDRKPANHSEEIACLKVDRDTIRKRVYGK